MTSETSIRPVQPQTIGEVLDTSFRLYRLSFAKVWPLCLLMAVASSPTAVYMFAHPQPQPSADNPFAALAMFENPTYWVSYLIGTVLTLCVMGALYLRQNAVGSGEDLSNIQALRLAVPKVLPLFAMSILFAIAVAVGTLLLLVPGIILMLSLSLCFVIANRTDAALYTFIVSQLVAMSAGVLVTPYFIALMLTVYWDLKLRKQGGDLAARVGALGTV